MKNEEGRMKNSVEMSGKWLIMRRRWRRKASGAAILLHPPPHPQRVDARRIEPHPGRLVEVARRGLRAVEHQRHLPALARAHHRPRVFRRQAAARHGHVDHRHRPVARVGEAEDIFPPGTVRREGAEVVEGVGEGDCCGRGCAAV